MRINFKIILFFACGFVLFVTVSLWMYCGADLLSNSVEVKSYLHAVNRHQNDDVEFKSDIKSNTAVISRAQSEEIDCNINGEYTINCRKEADEVYIPFSFIHKYFEVYGKLANYDGFERFEWSHSYSKVHQPKQKYSTQGVFTYFENYKVEERDRVKCISGIEGVPVTTQWNPSGYFYPTQIAQFGLAHYSKNLTEAEPKKKLFSYNRSPRGPWIVPFGAIFEYYGTNDSTLNSNNYLKFSTSGDVGVTLKDEFNYGFVLSLNLKLLSSNNSSIRATLLDQDKREVWFLHYVCANFFIKAQMFNIYHGIRCDKWTALTRDLFIDLQKGLTVLRIPKKRISRSKLKIAKIQFYGSGLMNGVTVSSSDHLKQFFASAEWLVSHQNTTSGGWPNPVRRKLGSGFSTLEPGWYSAMGQGHGISVLSRAYFVSKNTKYLDAAVRALKPFHLLSQNGGVLTFFMDQLAWYEEYPTEPSSFTLNGFIYSLIGLYDLMSVAPSDKKYEASHLFNDGMESLKKMLLFFDTGSGSIYDLRHISLKTVPNLARWDYHATHVNQLFLLFTIYEDDLLQTTATRWHGYMKGIRAQHN